MSPPSADVSCRVAWADDADAIAGRAGPGLAVVVRRRAAGRRHLRSTPTRAAAGVARRSVAAPGRPDQGAGRPRAQPGRRLRDHHPGPDPDCDPVADAELMELTVDPAERGLGHGSRLLQAAVDTMAADRFGRAVLWAIAGDEALRGFLTGAGWAPDTAHRELDLDGDGDHAGQAGPAPHRPHVDLTRSMDPAERAGSSPGLSRGPGSAPARRSAPGGSRWPGPR